MKTIFTTVAALQAGNLKSQGAIMVMPFTDQDMALKAADLAAARAGSLKLTDAALDLGKESILLAVHDTARQGFVSTINQALQPRKVRGLVTWHKMRLLAEIG